MAASDAAPAASTVGRWRDRLADWRNRLVADPRFQRLAADVPFVRRVASRHAASLFDLCAGFVYTQVLLAVVRLRLVEHLADGPLDLAAIARRLELPPDGTRTLVDAAAALGLLERRSGGRYGLGIAGAALLGNPGLAAMIEHHALVYRDLEDPVALLRRPAGGGAGLSGFWSYAREGDAGADGASAARYSALMAATQGFVQEDAFAAYRFDRHRTVLDVGGGDGGFLAALGRRLPQLDLVLFDLPPVAALAAARFAEQGLAGRATAVGGDFRTDALPRGADLVCLVRILHDHDDATVRALLAAVHAALEPGGRVLVVEPFGRTPGIERVGDAYFGLYLRAMGRGRARSAQELTALLAEAGFRGMREHRTRRPMLTSLLSADR